MDDGVVLLADRYAPLGTRARADRARPLALRAPRARSASCSARLLAERGLQTVVQSIRGTFGSGGRFDPFDERDDGLATLRWLREQPWHAGRVGTIGPSYMGIVQWAIAGEVDAMAPSVTASQFRGMAHGSGSISLDTALSWMLVLRRPGAAPRPAAAGARPAPQAAPASRPACRSARSTSAALGMPVPFFREWMEQMAPDSPYWAARDFSVARRRRRARRCSSTGGWYDIFLPWLVEDFRALRARRPRAAARSSGRGRTRRPG